MRWLMVFAALLIITPSAWSLPAFVQCQQNAPGGTIGSIAVTITTTAGNLLVSTLHENTDSTTTWTQTDTAGNTWTQVASGYSNDPSTQARLDVRVSPNASAVTSVTATLSGAKTSVTFIVCEFSGMALSSPQDTSVNSSLAGFGTSLTSGTYTTTNAKDVLFYAVNTDAFGSAFTAGTGFTIPANGTSGGIEHAIQYQIVSSIQTSQTTSMSWTGSNRAASVFAAFKGASTAFVVRRRAGVF